MRATNYVRFVWPDGNMAFEFKCAKDGKVFTNRLTAKERDQLVACLKGKNGLRYAGLVEK